MKIKPIHLIAGLAALYYFSQKRSTAPPPTLPPQGYQPPRPGQYPLINLPNYNPVPVNAADAFADAADNWNTSTRG